MQLAAENEPDAHSRPDRQECEVVHAARDPQPALAERCEVDVVLERDGETEALAHLVAECAALEARHVRCELQRSGRGFDHARNPDHCAVDQLGGNVADLDQRVVQRHDRAERALGVRAADLNVLARADRAAEVADRAAEEACAEIEAEHERRVGDRLEEHGAVARPSWLRRRLADEPRVEQRLQGERDGRLRDSRQA